MSRNLRYDHGKDCDTVRENNADCGQFCHTVLLFNQNTTGEEIHPFEKGPWFNDLCQEEKQSNKKSYPDQKAFEKLLEQPFMLDLAEHYRLKERE